MAHLYKRRNKYWICYYPKGENIQESLHTDNERIARDKKRKIKYDLSISSLRLASQLLLPLILEDFCRYLKTARTYKSYKNDISRLRVFFGPICASLEICPPGIKRGQHSSKPMKDKYAVDTVDRNGDCLSGPNEDNELSAAGDRGVQEIPLQQGVMLGVDRDDDHRILASLALVHGRCIGEHQLIQLIEVVGDFPLVEADNHLLLDLIKPHDAADIAIIRVIMRMP